MCFVLSKNSKIKKLRKDKVVYKIIYKNNHSPYRNFKWNENRQYKLGKPLSIKNYIEIHEGYHTFTTYKAAIQEILFCPIFNIELMKIIKLIVPKNSEYAENKYDNCISNIIKSKSLKNIIKEETINKKILLSNYFYKIWSNDIYTINLINSCSKLKQKYNKYLTFSLKEWNKLTKNELQNLWDEWKKVDNLNYNKSKIDLYFDCSKCGAKHSECCFYE